MKPLHGWHAGAMLCWRYQYGSALWCTVNAERGTMWSSRSTGLRSVMACASTSVERKCSTLKAFHSDTATGQWKVTGK